MLAILAGAASAETRLALIIANQDYSDKVGALVNPLNDAALMKSALEAHDFDVRVLPNASRGQILAAVDRLAVELGQAGPASTGFLYYSGHGAAKPNTNRNYIIPVTVRDASSSALWFDSVPLEDVRRLLREGAPNAAHIVVFDACRSELKVPSRG